MRRRSRAPRGLQHAHCDSCYSRRCRAPAEEDVCCALVSCRLLCGAVYHQCKEPDHLLLCPDVRVPCLNVQYGCPAHLTRSSRAAHLQDCPASVVSCSMEWLRWLTDDTDPHGETALRENLLNEGPKEDLDLALALADQSDLFARLKMKTLFPELTEQEEVEEETKQESKVVVNSFSTDEDAVQEVHTSSPAETSPGRSEELVLTHIGQNSGTSASKRSLCDMMFSMERGGCAAAAAAHPDRVQNQDRPGGVAAEKRVEQNQSRGPAEPPVSSDSDETGRAPWHEGVLDRLGHELSPQEFNMYVVHHGRMLLAFGQIQACTPREKDFVYGSLEPIPVQTLRSFKVPDSYHYRHRVHLYDVASRAKSETLGVDTSDLQGSEDDWFSDEASAALLVRAEVEVKGHKISESRGSDGLYVDQGTQTHRFRSAPFSDRTTLEETMTGRALKLNLQLQTQSVSSRNHRANSVFGFSCGHTFHRRDFATHCRNVHSDIHTCVSGWFQLRCPLAYLGCTFTQSRFQPSTHEASVTYDRELRCFNLRPRGHQDRSSGSQTDLLSSLPFEVLCHVTRFLDSLSLSQLALVSRLLRQVCCTRLQDRGMVTLSWERRASKWTATPVWSFSRLFSPVDSWRLRDVPHISAHLRHCPHYETVRLSDPQPLVNMTHDQNQNQNQTSGTRTSLVQQFSCS